MFVHAIHTWTTGPEKEGDAVVESDDGGLHDQSNDLAVRRTSKEILRARGGGGMTKRRSNSQRARDEKKAKRRRSTASQAGLARLEAMESVFKDLKGNLIEPAPMRQVGRIGVRAVFISFNKRRGTGKQRALGAMGKIPGYFDWSVIKKTQKRTPPCALK